MIESAQLWREELKQLYNNTFYDERYRYYRSWFGTKEMWIPDNNYESHHFAITEGKLMADKIIIGYVCYNINFAAKVVNNIGIISFGSPKITFGVDLMKIIDNIFMKYNMNKIEFRAFADNPVIKHYYKFIHKYGGREVGILKDSVMLDDGKLHDDVMFELFKEDYLKHRRIRK